MSTISRNAGTSLLGLYVSHSHLKRSSGTFTRAWSQQVTLLYSSTVSRCWHPAAAVWLPTARCCPEAATFSIMVVATNAGCQHVVSEDTPTALLKCRKFAHVVGVDGAEGEVLRWNAHFRERIEQRALAHIGQAHNANL